MIKNLGPRKLGKTGSQRKAMLSNMAASLLMHEQIQTTIPKAKELRRVAEGIINEARKGRLLKLRSLVQSKAVYKKVVDVLAPRYAARNGGYTRILRLGRRKGPELPRELWFLERSLRLLRPGGLIAIDNVLWHGDVSDPGKTDAETEIIRAFNRKLQADKRVSLSIVPLGDGLTLACKL